MIFHDKYGYRNTEGSRQRRCRVATCGCEACQRQFGGFKTRTRLDDVRPVAVAGVGRRNRRFPPRESDRRGLAVTHSPVLLTKAIIRPSGDHDGTLIVPWPP